MLNPEIFPKNQNAFSAASLPWDLKQPARIPVAKPKLVELAAALPYLKSIDESRTYSNFGPLNARLEERLAEHFKLDPDCVVTCSNATSGLTIALQRAAENGGRYCLMPAWTFAATAHAAVAAGLWPFLTDVDPATGALTPEIASEAVFLAGGNVSAVVPVAPFGLPLDAAAWDAFSRTSGIEVVVDAAAGFDALTVGEVPAVVSLHATKVLGIGEGGFLASRNPAIVADVRRRANFGFDGSRDASLSGCNAKLSEISAAYGHAALDVWGLQRSEYLAVMTYYQSLLGDLPGLRLAPGAGLTWVSSTFNIEAPESAILEIERRLTKARIATRRWWGQGLHGHSAFARLPRTPLPVTNRLAANTLGLPCWPGLSPFEVDEISAVVRAVLKP